MNRDYMIFTNTNGNMFVIRSSKKLFTDINDGYKRFGNLWKYWCAERMTKEQYEYAKENKKIKLNGRIYRMTHKNTYVGVGETMWGERIPVRHAVNWQVQDT